MNLVRFQTSPRPAIPTADDSFQPEVPYFGKVKLGTEL